MHSDLHVPTVSRSDINDRSGVQFSISTQNLPINHSKLSSLFFVDLAEQFFRHPTKKLSFSNDNTIQFKMSLYLDAFYQCFRIPKPALTEENLPDQSGRV